MARHLGLRTMEEEVDSVTKHMPFLATYSFHAMAMSLDGLRMQKEEWVPSPTSNFKSGDRLKETISQATDAEPTT